MIDTHCHIDLYNNPLKVTLECERLHLTTIGMTNLPSHFEIGINHVKTYKYVRLALGMHPLHASVHKKELPIFFKNVSRTSYIGEIGLDFSKEGIDTKEIQLSTFKSVLEAVKNSKKLLSIHSRKAEKEVLSLLKEFQIKLAIFHWYSGPLSLINDIALNGYYFSINPAMIKSQNGQKIISRIPKEKILTETDGPFVDIEGKPALPFDVKLVLEYLAEKMNKSRAETESLIDSNFKQIITQLKL